MTPTGHVFFWYTVALWPGFAMIAGGLAYRGADPRR